MHVSKIVIHNFKCFGEAFEVNLKNGLNVLVGDNESGKSTILEATNLVLSRTINGGRFGYELSQDLFNKTVVEQYIADYGGECASPRPDPPHMEIDIYLDGFDDDSGKTEENRLKSNLRGNGNLSGDDDSGVRFLWLLDDKNRSEFEKLQTIESLPIEYYTFRWETFSRDPISEYSSRTPRSFLIDSAKHHLRGGHDSGVYGVVKDDLPNESVTQIRQAYRQLQDNLGDQIGDVNSHLGGWLTDFPQKRVELGISSLRGGNLDRIMTTYVDGVPFQLAGMGERSMIKTKLALASSGAQRAGIILVEEPECHLSHSSLNILLNEITDNRNAKQVIVSTHSSFVANKLGLDSLILLSGSKPGAIFSFDQLGREDSEFFETLPGYDTLRVVLCKAAVLVEGPSDELIVQKTYHQKYGRLPINDGVEVVSVGNSAPRFLEIARYLNKKVAIVLDTDGKPGVLRASYERYGNSSKRGETPDTFLAIDDEDMGDKFSDDIKRDLGDDFNYNTLEPHLFLSFSPERLKNILGKPEVSESQLLNYMHNNKTRCALDIFKRDDVDFGEMPQYILDAVEFVAKRADLNDQAESEASPGS